MEVKILLSLYDYTVNETSLLCRLKKDRLKLKTSETRIDIDIKSLHFEK